MSDQVTPVPTEALAPSRRRLLVVASDAQAANPVLRLDFLDAVIAEPAADQSLPEDTGSDFDDLVVADFDRDPAVLARRMAHASRHLRDGGTVSVALTADIGEMNSFDTLRTWGEALSPYSVDGIDAGGTVLRLRKSVGADPTTGAALLGALQAAHAARSDRRDLPPAALQVEQGTGAAAHDAEALAAAEAENATLQDRVRSLERSRPVRVARRLTALRKKGPAGAIKSLTGIEAGALALATLVGLIAVVVVIAALTAITDNLGVSILITLVAVAIVLAAIRGEIERWRLRRRIRAIDARLASTGAKQTTALKRIAARTRAHQNLLNSLDRQFMTSTAAGVDTAHAVVGIAEDLRNAHPERVRKAVATDSTKQYEQLQAAMNLFALVDVDAAVPALRGWAVSPDALLVVLTELLARRPALVLECGSGSSTLWTALAIKKFGLDTRIVSLDHDDEYRRRTAELLVAHGVSHLADVRHAPLVPTGIAGHDTPWYDLSVVADLTDVGLLFVDGPPEASGPLARYPAVPLLLPHLAPDAVIVLDDAVRVDERAAVERWLRENPTLTTEYLRTEKGTSIVRRS